jgi:hypothetical protein
LRGKKKKKKEIKKEKRRNKAPLLHATDLCWETKKEQKKMKLAWFVVSPIFIVLEGNWQCSQPESMVALDFKLWEVWWWVMGDGWWVMDELFYARQIWKNNSNVYIKIKEFTMEWMNFWNISKFPIALV